MDAAEALTELTRLSAEIEHVAILDGAGDVLAATPGIDAERLGRTALELLDLAGSARPEARVDRIEVDLADGGVFVVRVGERVAIATTRQEAPAALVVYDLRTCLSRIDPPAPPARPRKRKASTIDA